MNYTGFTKRFIEVTFKSKNNKKTLIILPLDIPDSAGEFVRLEIRKNIPKSSELELLIE